METDEEALRSLIHMGFSDVTEIKRALNEARNDLSEAVAILTHEKQDAGLSYDVPTLSEMKEMNTRGLGKGGNEYMDLPNSPVKQSSDLPPSYDEVMEPVESEDPSAAVTEIREESMEDSKEFPVTNLYELQSRVFTDQWSIPYKKEESLGKCLLAAIRMAQQETMESDEHCMSFVQRCLPEAIRKLMKSNAVHRWGVEIHEGIYNMLQLVVDLVAARLKYKPIPIELLELLELIFNPDTEYHYKNRNRQWEKIRWEGVFGVNQCFAVPPPPVTYKEQCGWLVNLINRFAEQDGIDMIKKIMMENPDELDPSTMTILLKPLGAAADYLNAMRIVEYLSDLEKVVLKYIADLKDNDLKQKKAGTTSDLLSTLKKLILNFWIEDVKEIDNLRLQLALRMLKSPHFNARMNSLKEIAKLIEDSPSNTKNAIEEKVLLDWLVEKKVLSIALEGNIDQTQYCDKLKVIVEFIGSRLSAEELTKIWKMQNDQPLTVVDNIHDIMAAAAIKFNDEQLEHLILLIQKAWKGENDRVQEKLLTLIGKIGRDTKDLKTTNKVLELLWDLAHLPGMSINHLEHAMDEHLKILSDSISVSQQMKNKYITKCVEDIKKTNMVVPAIRHLHQITRTLSKQSYSKYDKGITQELNKTHDIIKLITQSLLKCHKMAVNTAGGCTIANNPKVDGRYTHIEHVDTHLQFLAFILEQGHLYLPWHQAKEIWDCLIGNPEACNSDKETCYQWFTRGLNDLEGDTQQQLFREKILKINPANLSGVGFECIKAFFESINIRNLKLKKSGTLLIVEKLDLMGLEFLWQIALESPSEEIAYAAIQHIMKMSYTSLSVKLKKDQVALHKSFIAECSKRLELASITMGGTALAIAISQATRVTTAATIPEVSSVPCPSRSAKYLVIERLLVLARTYITTVEDQHHDIRTILPHGASFQGPPITFQICCESPRMEFPCVSHTNESLYNLRRKIAQKIGTSCDNIHMSASDKILLITKDNKLMRELDLEEGQIINVKSLGGGSRSEDVCGVVAEWIMKVAIEAMKPLNREVQGSIPGRVTSGGSSSKQNPVTELERMLPGVVMATGGQVFELLYQVAEWDEPKITESVRSLLMLIPTDPSIQETLDSITHTEKEETTGKTIAPPPPPLDDPDQDNKATLEGLFMTTSSGMSAFRLLYNLEVLSSRLMPSVHDDAATQSSSQSFREIFLSAGGLSLVTRVLQKDTIPHDVDLETRRGCYSIALQLARFLLCGQTTTALLECDLSGNDSVFEASLDSSANLSSSFSSSPRKISIVERMSSVEASGDTASKEGTSKARFVIQTMSHNEFTAMVSCLMKVAWSAAAGQLKLASTNQAIREAAAAGVTGANVTVHGRSRHSSTASSTSTSSQDSEPQFLHPGVCLRTHQISSKDALISREALELMVACLQLRPHNLGTLYTLSGVGDFIIDLLLNCPHTDVRSTALEQFTTLSQTDVNPQLIQTHQPKHFLLQTLLSKPVPLWNAHMLVRGTNSKVLRQCSQYFELRCRLLERLSVKDQKFLNIKPSSLLEDELDWLQNFEAGDPVESSLSEVDDAMLAGHLKLARVLLSCEGINKEKMGKLLINRLLKEYMYPASQLILKRGTDQYMSQDPHTNVTPKIFDREARMAAFDLLISAGENSKENLEGIASTLLRLHHHPDHTMSKEWEYLPPVEGRLSRFVGLKNGGATCYMNSILQQLYMTPGVREGILSANVSNHNTDNVFYQMQMLLGHLWESKLQYYEPDQFWRVFKFWGEPVNIREQQDAFDFFTILIDQIDVFLKEKNQKEVFRPKFQGVFLNEMICHGCPHRKEREEEFFALNLGIKSESLEASLEQFIQGEMLEGENAYLCEDCNEKRNTIKRTCIKTLPPVLVIQLKRFGYDWEAGRALKFDDYFKFPWVIDMEPYTSKGIKRREQEATNQEEAEATDESALKKSVATQSTEDLYQLVGIVVHSGQANAGHYYSFIRDRWTRAAGDNSKWYKFNDTIVEEFEMGEAAVEAECFGGSYKPKSYSSSSSYSTDPKPRYWSGYMLFYERIQNGDYDSLRGSQGRAAFLKQDSDGDVNMLEPLSSPELSPRQEGDRLSELSALVNRGERKGLFGDHMPPDIQRVIRDENLQFLRDRAIYNQEYFNFIRSLATCNLRSCFSEDFDQMSEISMRLALQFIVNTFFRTHKKLRCDLGEWCAAIANISKQSVRACRWALSFLAKEGAHNLCMYLLECITSDIREVFAKVVECIVANFIHKHSCPPESPEMDGLVEALLGLLEKDVGENSKRCRQYFWLLLRYMEMSVSCCKHLFQKGAFQKLVSFLVGPGLVRNQQMDVYSRSWTSLYTREFGDLHSLLAGMIMNCNMVRYQTIAQGDFPDRERLMQPPHKELLEMPSAMQEILWGPECLRYIRECVLAFREIAPDHCQQTILEMILYCSFCNEGFTMTVMMMIQYQVDTCPANELKPILELLLELLLLEDPLQLRRIKLAAEGNRDNGLLGIIKKATMTDSTRSYQCIKFLVLLANKCPTAKEYLMSIAPKWQWSVQWLKEKMSDHGWSSSSNQSNESSHGKSFQRTMSAQDTLEEATALLTGLTTQDVFDDDDVEQSNGDTSLEESEGNTTKEGPMEGEENEEGEEGTKNYDDVDN